MNTGQSVAGNSRDEEEEDDEDENETAEGDTVRNEHNDAVPHDERIYALMQFTCRRKLQEHTSWSEIESELFSYYIPQSTEFSQNLLCMRHHIAIEPVQSCCSLISST